WLDARTAHYRIAFRQQALAVGLHVVAQVGILAIGASLVRDGALTLGQLVAAEVVVTSVVTQALKLANKVETFYDLLAAIEKIGHMVDEDPLHVAAPASTRPHPPQGAHVIWTWAGTEVQAGPGGRVVVHDPDGVAALAELVRGVGGRDAVFRLDGRPVGAIAPRLRAERVVGIDGDAVVEGSVRDNLLLARTDAGDDEAWDALRCFGLVEVVGDLGLDATVEAGDRAWTRGRRLRLALARAWVAGASCVVLEGVLDSLSEDEAAAVWQDAQAAGSWTLFVVGRRRLAVDGTSQTWSLRDGRLREGQR
ncbi:MAG: hypothetical protein RLZZ383_384, partial [Pseudomonadota bacterium]